MQFTSVSPAETHNYAAQLAKESAAGAVYALVGSLGSGKTEFVRGFVRSLSPDTTVTSPSFTLVNTYPTDPYKIHHFDFYRLNSADELFEIGYYEYIADDSAVVLIEWADMFPEVLPASTRFIRFMEEEGDTRLIAIDDN